MISFVDGHRILGIQIVSKGANEVWTKETLIGILPDCVSSVAGLEVKGTRSIWLRKAESRVAGTKAFIRCLVPLGKEALLRLDVSFSHRYCWPKEKWIQLHGWIPVSKEHLPHVPTALGAPVPNRGHWGTVIRASKPLHDSTIGLRLDDVLSLGTSADFLPLVSHLVTGVSALAGKGFVPLLKYADSVMWVRYPKAVIAVIRISVSEV